MLKVSKNLRAELPPMSDTTETDAEWKDALFTFDHVDALHVPCCMGLGTRRMLFQTVRAMKAKTVLDIGTYVGLSALTFATAVGIAGNVVTLDIKDANDYEGYWATTGRPCSPEAMLRRAGLNHRVDFVTQDSVEFLMRDDRCFDFICIDGLHEAYQVYAEIELAMKHLNPGGLIFLDDVMPFDDPERPKGLDYIEGPYLALQKHLSEDAPLNVVYNSRDFDKWTATAFLLRKLP